MSVPAGNAAAIEDGIISTCPSTASRSQWGRSLSSTPRTATPGGVCSCSSGAARALGPRARVVQRREVLEAQTISAGVAPQYSAADSRIGIGTVGEECTPTSRACERMWKTVATAGGCATASLPNDAMPVRHRVPARHRSCAARSDMWPSVVEPPGYGGGSATPTTGILASALIDSLTSTGFRQSARRAHGWS